MTTETTARDGIVEVTKEQLVNDLETVMTDVSALMRELAGSTGSGFAAVRTKVEAGLAATRSKVNDARTAATEMAKGVAGASQAYVTENPWKTLSIAAATGLVIGFIFRRR